MMLYKTVTVAKLHTECHSQVFGTPVGMETGYHDPLLAHPPQSFSHPTT